MGPNDGVCTAVQSELWRVDGAASRVGGTATLLHQPLAGPSTSEILMAREERGETREESTLREMRGR